MAGDRVVVIGGTGFIGRVLVRRLVAEGQVVRLFSRSPAGAIRLDGPVEHVQGQLPDRDSVRRGVEGCAVVYDLSMGGGRTWDDFQRDFIRGAENVAAACLEHGVRRLVYTSSSAALYLGADRTATEADGTDPHPERRTSLYTRAKIAAERLLGALHRERGLPVVILRPALVVGEGGKLAHPGIGDWVSPTCCVTIGDGRTPLPFVLVDDVAEAMLLARDAPGIDGKTFNLAGDVRPSAAEYLAILAARTHRNFRHVGRSEAEVWGERTLFWLGKLALRRRKENPRPNLYEVRTGTKRTQLDCSAAKQLLGWRPESRLDAFIRRAIDPHLAPPVPGDLRLATGAA